MVEACPDLSLGFSLTFSGSRATISLLDIGIYKRKHSIGLNFMEKGTTLFAFLSVLVYIHI